MVLESLEPAFHYRERTLIKRSSRFCLKPVKTIQQKDQKKPESINVQLVKGKSNTIVNIDEEEARKVHQHGDFVIKKLHKIHKSAIWNIYIGRSFIDGIEVAKQGQEETDIDNEERSEFRADNPKSWSEDSLDHIENILKANEFAHDGVVAMFCVRNDEREVNVDFDEVAWELEKCLIYYYIRQSSEIIMNEEARMSRQGLEPQSRKCKTPGRKKAGYVVYLAYQLLDSLTYQQIVGESINDSLDVVVKKKQLTAVLNQVKMLPQIDERIRKSVKEVQEFMNSKQIKLINQIKEINDSERVDLISQFLNLIQMGNHCESGVLGLPQFISFLNSHQQENTIQRSSSRMSVSTKSPRLVRSQSISTSSTRRSSTLPRPSTASARKSSLASLSSSFSVAEESRRLSDSQESSTGSVSVKLGRKKSSLASIQSSGSDISTPETIRLEDSPKKMDTEKKLQKPARGKSANGVAGIRNGVVASVSSGSSGLPKRSNSFKNSTGSPMTHLNIPKSPREKFPQKTLSSSGSSNQSPRTTPRKNAKDANNILKNGTKNMKNDTTNKRTTKVSTFSRSAIPS